MRKFYRNYWLKRQDFEGKKWEEGTTEIIGIGSQIPSSHDLTGGSIFNSHLVFTYL